MAFVLHYCAYYFLFSRTLKDLINFIIHKRWIHKIFYDPLNGYENVLIIEYLSATEAINIYEVYSVIYFINATESSDIEIKWNMLIAKCND